MIGSHEVVNGQSEMGILLKMRREKRHKGCMDGGLASTFNLEKAQL